MPTLPRRSAWFAISVLLAGCAAQDAPPSVEESASASPVRRLTHDFGVVPPAKPQRCEFRIENTSAEQWTFAQFRMGCSCTVPEITTEVIAPGSHAVVTVHYKPPGESGDDVRTVDVHFQELAAPIVQLEIQAKVREPVTVLPLRVKFLRAAHGQRLQSNLVVCNYTKSDLPDPTPTCLSNWVVVGAPRKDLLSAGDAARQQWSVPITVDTAKLTPGTHEAPVTFARGKGKNETIQIPVEVQVVPPLEPTPSQLFFGTVKPGQPISVTFVVRSNTGEPADNIQTAHDLGDQLTLTRTVATATTATWTATLTPKGTAPIRGTVTLRSTTGKAPATEMPVIARVVAHD